MFRLIDNKFGMTLIEVLIAVTILGILIIPLSSFFYMSNQRARINVEKRQALSVGESHMEALRQEKFKPIIDKVKQGEPIPDEIVDKYTIKVDVELISVATGHMYKINFKVIWLDGEVLLSTLFSSYR